MAGVDVVSIARMGWGVNGRCGWVVDWMKWLGCQLPVLVNVNANVEAQIIALKVSSTLHLDQAFCGYESIC